MNLTILTWIKAGLFFIGASAAISFCVLVIIYCLGTLLEGLLTWEEEK